MIAALLVGVLGAFALLLWVSPGAGPIAVRGRRRRVPQLRTFARVPSPTTGRTRPSPVVVPAQVDGPARTDGRQSEGPPQGGSLRARVTGGEAPALPAAALVELTACQLDAGLSLPEAVGVLSESCAGASHRELARAAAALRLGLSWDTAWPEGRGLSRDVRDYRDALEFTASSATASASVLRGQAELVRRAQYRRAERAAEALAVKLVLPLGLCFLPAFMCWGVVPVLMSLLPRVFGS